MTGIYTITNTNSGRIYIGSAVNYARRVRAHKTSLNSNSHTNRYLQSAWNKYGPEAFRFSIILYCEPEFLLFWEQIAIDGYVATVGWDEIYNLSPTAGSPLGVKHSEETKSKHSKLMLGNKYSSGTIPSIETRAKMSIARKKRPGPFKGRVHAEESKEMTSSKLSGIPKSSQTKALMAAAQAQRKGIPRSPEVRAKISVGVLKNLHSRRSSK